jgi:antitoxin HicB
MNYKIPLVLTPQPEGGFTVTSPLLPELITEGDSIDEAMENVKDALAAVVEAYQELGRTLPIDSGARLVRAPLMGNAGGRSMRFR